MTTLMWGSSDAEMVELVRRLACLAMTQHQEAARLAERSEFVDQCDAVVAHELTRHLDDDVTRVNNAQVSQRQHGQAISYLLSLHLD